MSKDDAATSRGPRPKKISTALIPPKALSNPARWAYQRLVESIVEFEKNLDENHEVGGRLVSFSEGDAFHIEDLGYWGPDFILFYGRMGDGSPVELIQHLSQVSVMLISVSKRQEEAEAKRIGFSLAEKLEYDLSDGD